MEDMHLQMVHRWLIACQLVLRILIVADLIIKKLQQTNAGTEYRQNVAQKQEMTEIAMKEKQDQLGGHRIHQWFMIIK
tara:strand:- start:662 stop:895 length:234 start_codon:yes stop_codon:yes gene_type:complete